MISLANAKKKFLRIGDSLLPIVVLSKGCAKKTSDNHTTRKKLSKLAELIDRGALLAISKGLLTAIKEEKQDPTNVAAANVHTLIVKAKAQGQLLKRNEIPVFVDEEVNEAQFSIIDLALITKSETTGNTIWKEILADDGFSVGKHRVTVQLIDLDIVEGKFNYTTSIESGTHLDKIRDLLVGPFVWSSRIFIWDRYILKQHLAIQSHQESNGKNLWEFSGLEKFLNMLVNLHKVENRKPLDSLTIASKSFVKDSSTGRKYSAEQMIESMSLLAEKLDIKKYVKEVFVVWIDHGGSERWLGFENDARGFVFRFGNSGLGALESKGKKFEDIIQKKFSIKGPVDPSEWTKDKDFLRKEGLDNRIQII